MQVSVPCGQCIGCRLERSRQWAIRCVHEQQLHEQNCFLTLTFNDQHLNPSSSLVKSDFQLFMKRLRKYLGETKIRYFHCGEYGELLKRPHHHAILFGYDFPDKEIHSCRDDVLLYTSKTLEQLWGMGFCTIGEANFETAAYVARYIMKKVTGKNAATFYQDRIPPYNTMSRRPGIASAWFNKFKSDVYPDDFIVIRNQIVCKPPKYYDTQYDLTCAPEMAQIKGRRAVKARKSPDYGSLARLQVKEDLKLMKVKQLQRGLENET